MVICMDMESGERFYDEPQERSDRPMTTKS
jgi:hypothetical protein